MLIGRQRTESVTVPSFSLREDTAACKGSTPRGGIAVSVTLEVAAARPSEDSRGRRDNSTTRAPGQQPADAVLTSATLPDVEDVAGRALHNADEVDQI